MGVLADGGAGVQADVILGPDSECCIETLHLSHVGGNAVTCCHLSVLFVLSQLRLPVLSSCRAAQVTAAGL